MIVDYDTEFDRKRDKLARKLYEKDPTLDERAAQEKARLVLLKEKAEKAHKNN